MAKGRYEVLIRLISVCHHIYKYIFSKCFIQLPNFYRFSDLLPKTKVFKNVQIMVLHSQEEHLI